MNPFQASMKNDMDFHKSIKTNQEEITMKIDTSTIAGKISVMQAFEDGKKIMSNEYHGGWAYDTAPCWDWSEFDYCIKPQTVEQAAIENYNSIQKNILMTLQEHHIIGFIAGVKWQKDQGDKPDYRKKEFTIKVVHDNGDKLKVLVIRADLFDGDQTFEIILGGEQDK